jgi:hypothetical protein
MPKAQNLMFLAHRIEREMVLLRTSFASSLGQTMGNVTLKRCKSRLKSYLYGWNVQRPASFSLEEIFFL